MAKTPGRFVRQLQAELDASAPGRNFLAPSVSDRRPSKNDAVIALLQRYQGATIADLVQAIGGNRTPQQLRHLD